MLWFCGACFLFAGDYFVASIVPAFYLAWIGLIAFRYLNNMPLLRRELFIQGAMFLILIPTIIYDYLTSGSSYYNVYLYSILALNVLVSFASLIQRQLIPAQAFSAFLLMWGVIALYFLTFGEGREHFLFGPNIVYRIALFFTGIIVIGYFADATRMNLIWLIFSIISLLVIITYTSSRAGFLAASIFVVLLFLRRQGPFSEFRGKMLALLALPFALFFLSLNFESRVSRLVYFSLENSSEAGRVKNIQIASEYLRSQSTFDQVLGYSSNAASQVFNLGYPHNLFLEAYVYGGVLIFMLVLSGFLFFWKELIFSGRNQLIFFPMIGIGIGALFSGDFWENFIFLTIVGFWAFQRVGSGQFSIKREW